MRLRNVKNAYRILEENQKYVVLNPESHRRAWRDLFGGCSRLHIEIGSGKGGFLHTLAEQNPDTAYLGIERYDSILVRCVQRCIDQPRENLRFVKIDARYLMDAFAPGEVDRIYLNFSDPWPKKRHAKRRLTHKNFLDIFRKILAEEGEVHFKTDNRPLFEYSLQSMNNYGMRFNDLSLNLHEGEPADNVRTEYEERWSRRGSRIYRLEASFRRDLHCS
ncbi:MAG: tRNA (guanosine(46)-N7)-methyltransferase TrmB [Fibrobacterota bacterium]